MRVKPLLLALSVFAASTAAALPTAVTPLRPWEDLGGQIAPQISCTTWAANRIDCFARGQDSAMWHKWWDGQAWRGWESLGGALTSAPECVSWGANRIDCFANGPNGAMWHRWWDGSAWGGWEDLGGAFTSHLSCMSWGSNRLDCFATGQNKSLWHKWWDGAQWNGWEDLGGGDFLKVQSDIYKAVAPECVSPAVDRIVCLMRDGYGAMRVLHWNGSGWNWGNLGGEFTTDASCTAWTNRVDCFAVGSRYQMWHAGWSQGALWSAWGRPRWRRPGSQTGLRVVGAGQIDCFAMRVLDRSNNVWHTWSDGGAWGAWEDLGGGTNEVVNPECVSWGPNRLDCFGIGATGTMVHKYWDGSAWGPRSAPNTTRSGP